MHIFDSNKKFTNDELDDIFAGNRYNIALAYCGECNLLVCLSNEFLGQFDESDSIFVCGQPLHKYWGSSRLETTFAQKGTMFDVGGAAPDMVYCRVSESSQDKLDAIMAELRAAHAFTRRSMVTVEPVLFEENDEERGDLKIDIELPALLEELHNLQTMTKAVLAKYGLKDISKSYHLCELPGAMTDLDVLAEIIEDGYDGALPEGYKFHRAFDANKPWKGMISHFVEVKGDYSITFSTERPYEEDEDEA